MAIFNKSDTESNTTIVAEGTVIEGNLKLKCKLHIDGEISGKIDSSNVVAIGSRGLFKGEMNAKSLIISGVFEGEADCENIELLKDGKIKGKISTKTLMVEAGSFFEGESHVKEKDDKGLEIDSASQSI